MRRHVSHCRPFAESASGRSGVLHSGQTRMSSRSFEIGMKAPVAKIDCNKHEQVSRVPGAAEGRRSGVLKESAAKKLSSRRLTESAQFRSWREGQAFVAGNHPDADDAGLLTLLFLRGVIGARHRIEWAERHGDLNRVRTHRRMFAQYFVALDRAEVAFVAPVGDEIFHAITRLGLPEFVGFLRVAGDDRVKEMSHRAFFGIVAKAPPERDSSDENKRNDCER